MTNEERTQRRQKMSERLDTETRIREAEKQVAADKSLLLLVWTIEDASPDMRRAFGLAVNDALASVSDSTLADEAERMAAQDAGEAG